MPAIKLLMFYWHWPLTIMNRGIKWVERVHKRTTTRPLNSITNINNSFFATQAWLALPRAHNESLKYKIAIFIAHNKILFCSFFAFEHFLSQEIIIYFKCLSRLHCYLGSIIQYMPWIILSAATQSIPFLCVSVCMIKMFPLSVLKHRQRNVLLYQNWKM